LIVMFVIMLSRTSQRIAIVLISWDHARFRYTW